MTMHCIQWNITNLWNDFDNLKNALGNVIKMKKQINKQTPQQTNKQTKQTNKQIILEINFGGKIPKKFKTV